MTEPVKVPACCNRLGYRSSEHDPRNHASAVPLVAKRPHRSTFRDTFAACSIAVVHDITAHLSTDRTP